MASGGVMEIGGKTYSPGHIAFACILWGSFIIMIVVMSIVGDGDGGGSNQTQRDDPAPVVIETRPGENLEERETRLAEEQRASLLERDARLAEEEANRVAVFQYCENRFPSDARAVGNCIDGFRFGDGFVDPYSIR